jgi:hypothetical protein
MGHPGFAWAARREALESVGGLVDCAILGGGDRFMALSLIGQLEERLVRIPGSSYAATLFQWQEKAATHIRGNVGHVDTTLLHYWHGSKKDRGYDTRWRILADHGFDPQVDLRRDRRGLLELTADKPDLRDAIRAYFHSRNEDGTEL